MLIPLARLLHDECDVKINTDFSFIIDRLRYSQTS
jgi:hypothetical protein